jgi:hypothetical protein
MRYQSIQIGRGLITEIQQRAAKNAKRLGLTNSEWAAMVEQRGDIAETMMAYDPQGERLRMERERIAA